MPFNHYAKIKRILESQPTGWSVHKINKPTAAKNFKGETRYFNYYYRLYDNSGQPIPYCKFQQLDRFAQIMNLPIEDIVVVTDSDSAM